MKKLFVLIILKKEQHEVMMIMGTSLSEFHDKNGNCQASEDQKVQ